MATWISVAVMGGVAWLLLRPLLGGQVAAATQEREEHRRLRDLLSAKETAYAALREIEFDHMMRKLSDADFQTLRSQYRGQAVRLLKEIDNLRARAASGEKRGRAAGARRS